MIALAMVTVIVVLGVMVKELVWVAAIVDREVLVEGLIIDVVTAAEIIAVGVIVIDFKFTLPVSYFVDVPSSVVVDLFMNVLTSVVLGVLTGVLTDVSANDLAVAMTDLNFPVSTPFGEFSR